METWKKIPDTEYSVSDCGRVRNDRTGRIKKQVDNAKGYYKVDLYSDGVARTCRVHRLVGEAFVDNPDNKPMINHIDGDKHNNNVDNLEWVTNQENMIHASKMGAFANRKPTYGMRGKKNPNGGSKGRPIVLCETGETFKNAAEAERILGISDSSIFDNLHGLTQATRLGHFRYLDDYEN